MSCFKKIRITQIIDPDDFSALIGSKEDFDAKDVATNNLERWCLRNRPQNVILTDLVVGQDVVFRSKKWDSWVRGRVLLIDSDSCTVDLYCTDYMTSELIDETQFTYLIPKKFDEFHWPFSVSKCKLFGVKPIGSRYTSRAREIFQAAVEEETLECEIIKEENGVFVVDILAEDETGSIKSVSELLIEEELALSFGTSVGNSPGAGTGSFGEEGSSPSKPTIPSYSFDRLLHQRKTAREVKDSDEGSDEEDHEMKILLEKFGRMDSFEWESSDKTISDSQDYKRNVDSDPQAAVQEQIMKYRPDMLNEDVNKIIGLTTSTSTNVNEEWPELERKPGHRSHNPSSRGRGQRNAAAPQVWDRKQEKRSFHRHQTAPLNSQEPPAVKRTTGRHSRGRGHSHGNRPTNAANLRHEYIQQSNKYSRTFKELLQVYSEDTSSVNYQALRELRYEAKDCLADLPGPDEIYVFIEAILDHVIEDESRIELGIGLLSDIRSSQTFITNLTEVLSDSLEKHMKPNPKDKGNSRREVLCRFSAQLILAADSWDDNTKNHISAPLFQSLNRWISLSNQIVTKDSYEYHSMCLDSALIILNILCQYLQITNPGMLEGMTVSLKQRVLEDTVPSVTRQAILDFLLNEKEVQRSPGTIFSTKSNQAAQIKTKNQMTDTMDLQPIMCDSCVQASEEEISDCRMASEEPSFEIDQMSNASSNTDHYVIVRQMLCQLQLTDLYAVFKENAIRDISLRQLEFSDLKDLLKECGLKPGQIWEIKDYINKLDELPKSQEQEILNSHKSIQGNSPELHLVSDSGDAGSNFIVSNINGWTKHTEKGVGKSSPVKENSMANIVESWLNSGGGIVPAQTNLRKGTWSQDENPIQKTMSESNLSIASNILKTAAPGAHSVTKAISSIRPKHRIAPRMTYSAGQFVSANDDHSPKGQFVIPCDDSTSESSEDLQITNNNTCEQEVVNELTGKSNQRTLADFLPHTGKGTEDLASTKFGEVIRCSKCRGVGHKSYECAIKSHHIVLNQ